MRRSDLVLAAVVGIVGLAVVLGPGGDTRIRRRVVYVQSVIPGTGDNSTAALDVLLATTTTEPPPAPTATAATTPRTVPPASGDVAAALARIRACESGNRYDAVSPDGRYRGAYQFDLATWNAVGGTGDPAAAPPEEQDARAAALYASRGASPWPVCGR